MAPIYKTKFETGPLLSPVETEDLLIKRYNETSAGLFDGRYEDGFVIISGTNDTFELLSDSADLIVYHWADDHGRRISEQFILPAMPKSVSAADTDGNGIPETLFIETEDGSGVEFVLSGMLFVSEEDPCVSAIGNRGGRSAWTGCLRGLSKRAEEASFVKDGLLSNDPNFITNEDNGALIAQDMRAASGAYIGVGPYQNYTYIAVSKPEIAFIMDIRRGNVLQHLIAKAIMETGGESRIEFLRLLTMRAKGDDSPKMDAPFEEIFTHVQFKLTPLSDHDAEEHVRMITTKIEDDHGWPMTVQDKTEIRRYLMAFRECALNIRYEGCTSGTVTADVGGNLYAYQSNITWREQVAKGRGYDWLSSESSFQAVRSMHMRNRIIPFVGDLAGEGALREAAEALAQANVPVSYMYISNVEEWLLKAEPAPRISGFYENVATLPVTPESRFITTARVDPQMEFTCRGRGRFDPCLLSIEDYIKDLKGEDLLRDLPKNYLSSGMIKMARSTKK